MMQNDIASIYISLVFSNALKKMDLLWSIWSCPDPLFFAWIHSDSVMYSPLLVV